MQIALSLMANERGILSGAEELTAHNFRVPRGYRFGRAQIRVRAARPGEGRARARTDVLNYIQTNHFGTVDVRKHCCVMPRRWVILFM